MRVLIVEDDAVLGEGLIRYLQQAGYAAELAANGTHADTVLAHEDYDIVVLDIGLPGLDGYEVARRLPELAVEKRPLLVAVTGYARDGDRRRSEQAGIDLHLVKPVEPEQLLAILRRFQTVLAPGPHRARQMA